MNLQTPQVGLSDATEDVKLVNNVATLTAWANGNIDATNTTAAFAQSAVVNQSGQTVKGAVNIAASESRSNVAYGLLTTPDQISNVVVGTNGILKIRYQATWQESVAGAARAAIFLGANQLVTAFVSKAAGGTSSTGAQAAATNPSAAAALNWPLASCPMGLVSGGDTTITAYTGDVTTGQAIGMFGELLSGGGNRGPAFEVGGTVFNAPSNSIMGGACEVQIAAGTYAISVQFKASSGSVTASNRKLWVETFSPA